MANHSINRTDLDSSPPAEPRSPDPVLASYFRQQLQQRYADPYSEVSPGIALLEEAAMEQEEEEARGVQEKKKEEEGYDFRLFFSKPSSSAAAAGRVVLRSPSPTAAQHNGDGSRRGGRPDAYYFTGVTGPELAAQYAQAAVSGPDILAGLGVKWVRTIRSTHPSFILSFFIAFFKVEGGE